MIYIKFRGRLGNQMFQYAAARISAERINCRLLIEEPVFSFRGSPQKAIRGSSSYSLFGMFGHLRQDGYGHGLSLIRRLSPATANKVIARLCPNEFRPALLAANLANNERFDPRFFCIKKNTRMTGYFQSEKYFEGREDAVRSWFSPSQADRADAMAEWKRKGLDPDKLVAVHVRLGDYLRMTGGPANGNQGWVLSRAYYDRAFDYLSGNHSFALFSDQPEKAREFLGRDFAYVSRGMGWQRDFCLMASCKHIVVANSTFSWWIAWMNPDSDRIVIAPKYFLGWNAGEWFPADIMVPNWIYL